ncbi:SDR family oxidoreductase [Aliivibrio fischeri]|uniref:SDR family oxidoreductase n=1 Tax=Aliivibrio fischeri TaxID=668 RepID=UPI0006D03620|nr:SDR family oxidoreductase [Aliivibrio fischeri]USR94631.1 SDR family oxidoreductase [Aliivibrio fischeri ATCC 7744 = JCM 18803 = DSM 507]GGK28344.1 short-chain dehydrogenase [Aliivibrio fischeri]
MKHIFITGANRGIGLSFVKYYLQQGHKVSATYRDTSTAQELLQLENDNPELSLYQLELTNYTTIQDVAKTLCHTPIDILINNAGYYGPKGYGFGHCDVEEWKKVFEINAIAPQKIVEALYPSLQLSRDKTIVCISSKVGSMTENTSGGGYIYRSSKAALNSVVKSLSNDLKPEGFTVIAMHPGWVQTEMGGPNALISTEESVKGLTKVIAQLSIENSGQFLNFDGTELPW